MRMLVGLVILLIANWGLGETEGEDFEDYREQLAQHPSILAIRAKAEQYEALSEGELGLPDPHIILGVDNLPVTGPTFDQFLPSSKVLGIRQVIPHHSVRHSKAAVQKRLADHQALHAAVQQARLQASFLQQLIRLDKIKKLEGVLQQQVKLYRLMEKDLRGQLEAGKAVYGRFSAIDIEQAEIEQTLNDLHAEQIMAEQILVELVGAVPSLVLPTITQVSWQGNAERLLATQIAADSVEIYKQHERIAEANFKPNFGVQALYKQRESGANFEGDDWFSIQATVTVPLWSRHNQAPKLRAAQAASRSAQSAYEREVRRWQQTLTRLAADIDVAAKNIRLLQQKQDAWAERIAAIERNYESGSTPLLTVLEAQISQLDINGRLVKQTARHLSLIADFNSYFMSDDI